MHCLALDRPRTGEHQRTRATINRLRMYKNFKPVRYCVALSWSFFRDRTGKIIKAAPFQEWLKSGTVARIEPNRKWFGKRRFAKFDHYFRKHEGNWTRSAAEVPRKHGQSNGGSVSSSDASNEVAHLLTARESEGATRGVSNSHDLATKSSHC